MKVAHRGAPNNWLTLPLSEELAVRAKLVDRYEGPSSAWQECTGSCAHRADLKKAEEALLKNNVFCIAI